MTDSRRMKADKELIERIASSTGLEPQETVRVIDDVVAWHHQTLEDYLARRHASLRQKGLRNVQIYPLLRAEVAERVFAAPPLTERQVRRSIYG